MNPVEALPEWPLIRDLVAAVDDPGWVSWLSHLPAPARIVDAGPKERGGILICACSVTLRPVLHGLRVESERPWNRRGAMKTAILKVAPKNARFSSAQVELLAQVLDTAEPQPGSIVGGPLHRDVTEELIRVVVRSVDGTEDESVRRALHRILRFARASYVDTGPLYDVLDGTKALQAASRNPRPPRPPKPTVDPVWGPLVKWKKVVTTRFVGDQIADLTLDKRMPADIVVATLGSAVFRDLSYLDVKVKTDVDGDSAAEAFVSVGPRPELRTLLWPLSTSIEGMHRMVDLLPSLELLHVVTASATVPPEVRELQAGGLGAPVVAPGLRRVVLGYPDRLGVTVRVPDVAVGLSLIRLAAVWDQLESMEIRGAGPEAMAVLAGLPPPARLARLRVVEGTIGDAGAIALATAAAGWPKLSLLDVSTNEIGPSGVRALYAVNGLASNIQELPRALVHKGRRRPALDRRAFVRLVAALAEVATRAGSRHVAPIRAATDGLSLRTAAQTVYQELARSNGEEQITARELLGFSLRLDSPGWGHALSLALGTIAAWRTDGRIVLCHDPRPLDVLVDLGAPEWPSTR